jgi:hypothetical protein
MLGALVMSTAGHPDHEAQTALPAWLQRLYVRLGNPAEPTKEEESERVEQNRVLIEELPLP